MAEVERSRGLQTIFSFFLGLMVTAFVGVGVYTFHPPPQTEFDRQIQDLDRKQQAIWNSRPPNELTPEDRNAIQELNNQRNQLTDAARLARAGWGRSTSIILIAFATLTMAVSLVHADQLPVISSGLLLGGIFTMVYGVGWIVATDPSVARFIVMTVAFLITLGLGYVRFVRRQAMSPAPSRGSIEDSEGLAAIEQRVRDLEERMDAAANALGHEARSEKKSGQARLNR